MSHGALEDADHEQPDSVDIPTDSGPPAAATVSRVLLKLNVHGAPAWLRAAFCEPTVIEPVRGDGTGFAATANGIVASPCPLCAPPIETQAASAAIDHVQSRAAEIVADPEPPPEANDDGVLATDTEHLSADGATTEEEVVEEVQAARARPPTARAATERRRRNPIRPIRTSLMHVPRHHEATESPIRSRLCGKSFPFVPIGYLYGSPKGYVRAIARSICPICRATCPAAKSASS